MTRVCAVCGGMGEQRIHVAREMMFGRREPFRYGECPACGCLRLLDVPDDLSEYYPPDYYSFEDTGVAPERRAVRAVKSARAALALHLPPAAVDRLTNSGTLPGIFRWTAGLGLATTSSVADIGCGGGQVLGFFARNGFRELIGFDPYLPSDRFVLPGLKLRRGGLDEVVGRWDLVMLHHSFEHMPEPRATVRALAALTAPDGAVIIRTPVADSWAWRHYGVDWVQLDAPRHLFVHTTRSIEELAHACGLRVYRSFRDSHGFQFWGSELLKRDLPLRDNEAQISAIFGEAALQDFERRAAELNSVNEGDSACIVLRHA